ncbi:MAG: histidine phosphatase family protein, partial [Desulfobacterales bacterium]
MPIQPNTTLLAIRHGETVWNEENRFQGHGDSPLTETGRNQVAALGRRMQKIRFDSLISSDLGRTRETASIIADFTGHSVEVDSRLRERNYGVLEGLTVPEIKARHSAVLDQLKSDDPDYIIPEGESHRQHYQRNVAFIEELIVRRSG